MAPVPGKLVTRKIGPPVIDGEFYARARYDVRSPLTAILGFAESMDEAIFGPLGHEKYDEYAAAIHKSGLGLEKIFTAILAILSLDADAITLSEDALSAEQVFVMAQQPVPGIMRLASMPAATRRSIKSNFSPVEREFASLLVPNTANPTSCANSHRHWAIR